MSLKKNKHWVGKVILCNHKDWLKIQFLVFASLPGFLIKQIEIKKPFIIKVLSGYDHDQHNMKLPRMEIESLALQDN